MSENESEVGVKEFLNIDLNPKSIWEYAKLNYNEQRNLNGIKYYPEVVKDILYEKSYIELTDLDDIDNIKIIGLTFDISTVNKKTLNKFLVNCSSEDIIIKKFANFLGDREVISREGRTNNKSEKIIEGKDRIKIFKVAIISILFLENYRKELNLGEYEIIKQYMEPDLKSRLNEKDVGVLTIVRNHLEKNCKEEYQTLLNIAGIERWGGGSVVELLKRVLNRFCYKMIIAKRLVGLLKR